MERSPHSRPLPSLPEKLANGREESMGWSQHPLGSDRPYRDGFHEAKLTLREKLPYYDHRGFCYLFADSAEHCIVWFSRRERTLDVGARIRARFEVKSHRVYNGVMENITKNFSVVERL